MNEDLPLDEIIKKTRGPVIIFLSSGITEEDEKVRKIINNTKEEIGIIIEIRYSLWKKWAENYNIFGAPAVLVFKDGKLKTKLLGTFSKDVLDEITRG